MYDGGPQKNIEIQWHSYGLRYNSTSENKGEKDSYSKNSDTIEDTIIEDILNQLNIFATQPELILLECDFLLNHFHAKNCLPKSEHILYMLQKINASMLQLPQTQSNRNFLDALIYSEKGIYPFLEKYHLTGYEEYQTILTAIENCYNSQFQTIMLPATAINEYLSTHEVIKSIRYHQGQLRKIPSSSNPLTNKIPNLRALAGATETLFRKVLQQHYQHILSGLEQRLTQAKTNDDVQAISDQLEECIPVWIEQQQYAFARKLLSALYKHNLIATRELGSLLRKQLLFLRYQVNQHAAKHQAIMQDDADAEIALSSLFYTWQQQQATLRQFRINLPCYFKPEWPRENLAAVLEQQEGEETKIISVEQTEETLSLELINFTTKLFKRCQQFLGESPEAFALFALGSLSLNAATPYSDIEYGLVRESDKSEYSAYFNDLLELFHLSVELIGEASLTDSNDRRSGYQGGGYHVDGNMHPFTALHGKNKGNARLQGSVISIIATLTSIPTTEDDAIEPSDKISNALQHTALIYAAQPLNSIIQGQTVFKTFQKAITDRSEEAYFPQSWQERQSFGQLEGIAWHSVRAVAHLNDMVMSTVGVAGLKPLAQKISIKEHLYAPLKYWIMDLANYYNFPYNSVHEALLELEKNNKLNKAFSASLKKALLILTVIRYRAQLYYRHQKEDEYVVIADETQIDNEHYILNAEEIEYLRWIYQCVFAPCYLLLKSWGMHDDGLKKHGKNLLNKLDHCSKLDPAVDLMKQRCDTYPIELQHVPQSEPNELEHQIIRSYIATFVYRFNFLSANCKKNNDKLTVWNDLKQVYLHLPTSKHKAIFMGELRHWQGKYNDESFFKNAFELGMLLKLYYAVIFDEIPPRVNLKEIFAVLIEQHILPAPLGDFLHNTSSALSDISERSTMPNKNQLQHLQSLFTLLLKAMVHGFSQLTKMIKNPKELNINQLITGYFLESHPKCFAEENYQNWFIEATLYLLYTQAPLETHRHYYRKLPEEYKQHCLTSAKIYFEPYRDIEYWQTEEDFWQKLWDAPLSNGERQSHQEQKANWTAKLSNQLLITTKEAIKSEGTHVYVDGLKVGKFALKPEIITSLIENKWLNKYGVFTEKREHPIAARMPGNHLVIPWPLPDNETINTIFKDFKEKNANNKNKTEEEKKAEINEAILNEIQSKAKFYFKVYPEYPLVDLFLNELTYRLGHYPPREVDVWLWQCETNHYPILVSEAVSGKTFEEVLKNNYPLQLNRQAFSESVIVSALASFEDNKPDNIILLQEALGSRLCLIDADRWFAPAFKLNKLHAKNAIFCLKEMSTEINPVFREELLSLNPQQVLQGWVDEMEKMGKKSMITFEGKIKLYFENKDNTKKTLLLPPLLFHAVNELFNHLQNIQVLLSEKGEDERNNNNRNNTRGKRIQHITHSEILSKIDTRIANHYGLAREKHKRSMDCFEYAAGHAYIKGEGLQQEHFSTVIDFKTGMQDMWGKEEEQKRAKLGIEENWKTDIEIAKVHLARLTEKEEIIEAARRDFLKGNFTRFLQLGFNGKDKILEDLDWSKLNPEKQRELLSHMMNPGCWRSINIHHSKEVKDDDIRLLIQKSPLLKKLHLSHCENLTYRCLEGLPVHDSTIKVIMLEGLKSFTHVGYVGGVFSAEKCLELPQLDKLSIINCDTLEEIHINAPQLKDIHLDNLPRLKILQTQSQSLENLRLAGSTVFPSECHKIVNINHGENINIIEYRNKGNQRLSLLEKLIIKFPVLICIDWHKYEKTTIQQFISQSNTVLEGKAVDYFRITLLTRKKLLADTENLLMNFNLFVKHKVIDALIKALGDNTQVASPLLRLGQESGKVIDALIKALGDSKSSVRAKAASALGNLRQPTDKVIDALIKALGDKELFVKIDAACALMQLGQESDKVIDALIKGLGASYNSVSTQAMSALGNLKQPNDKVIDALIKALGKLGYLYDRFRSQAASVLGNLKQPTDKVIDALTNALGDKEQEVRTQAASALGNLKQPTDKVIDALIKALGDNEQDVKTKAASALMQLAQESYKVIGALIKGLGDSNLSVRTQAASALVQLGQEFDKVIDALIKGLGDSDSSVRSQAASTLGNLKQPTDKVIEALIKAFWDSDSSVRTQAASALVQLGQESVKVIDALIKASGNSDVYSSLRIQAAAVLVELGQESEKVIDTLIKGLGVDSDVFTSVKTQAASALKNLKQQPTDKVIDALIKALWDFSSDSDARTQAASALGNLKQPTDKVIDALIKALQHSFLKTQAVSALVQLGQESEKVIDALIIALGDSFLSVRTQAASALVQLGQESEKVIDALIKASGNSDLYLSLRTDAESALGNLKQPTDKAIDALIKALGDKKKEVRIQAVSALGNLKQPTDKVIDALINALGDKKQKVRIQAASALANLGGTLNNRLDNLFKLFEENREKLIFTVLDENNFGKLKNKEVSAYMFKFFDLKTSKSVGCLSKVHKNLQNDIQQEMSLKNGAHTNIYAIGLTKK